MTSFIGITEVSGNTHTCASSCLFPAFRVRATRWWRARWYRVNWCQSSYSTLHRRVTCVALGTDADRCMANNSTVGVGTAGLCARILTLSVYASHLWRAFTVSNTLGTTIWWRSYKVRLALTWRNRPADFLTNRIGPTWRRLTRIYRYQRVISSYKK